MRANTCVEHRVPSPERLFPEGLRPSELAIFDHALVAAPHIVHEDIDRPGLADDQIECCFHLDVILMVAADSGDLLVEAPVIHHGTARNEDPRTHSRERARDPSADTSCGSRDYRDFTI